MDCPLCPSIVADLDAHVAFYHPSAHTLDVVQAMLAKATCTLCGAHVTDAGKHEHWHSVMAEGFTAMADGVDRIKSTLAETAVAFDFLNDEVERVKAGQALYEAHVENLIERVYELETGDGPAWDIGRVSDRVDELATAFAALNVAVEGLNAAVDIIREHSHGIGVAGGGSHAHHISHTHSMSPPTISGSGGMIPSPASTGSSPALFTGDPSRPDRLTIDADGHVSGYFTHKEFAPDGTVIYTGPSGRLTIPATWRSTDGLVLSLDTTALRTDPDPLGRDDPDPF